MHKHSSILVIFLNNLGTLLNHLLPLPIEPHHRILLEPPQLLLFVTRHSRQILVHRLFRLTLFRRRYIRLLCRIRRGRISLLHFPLGQHLQELPNPPIPLRLLKPDPLTRLLPLLQQRLRLTHNIRPQLPTLPIDHLPHSIQLMVEFLVQDFVESTLAD